MKKIYVSYFNILALFPHLITHFPVREYVLILRDIENIKFKKDYLLFKNKKNLNYSVTCKGNRHLTFQSPLIIEPQKMGYKICSNDVLKLKEYSCFIDEIKLIVDENKD